MSLNELAQSIHDNAVAHGFWEGDRNFGETIALMHAELSEALEEHRAGNALIYEVDGKPEGTAVEIVDCIIRGFDWLAHENVDIEQVIKDKMAYNATRPYKHNKIY